MAIIKKEVDVDSLHNDFDLSFMFVQDDQYTTVKVEMVNDVTYIEGELIPMHMDLLCEAWMEFKKQVKK